MWKKLKGMPRIRYESTKKRKRKTRITRDPERNHEREKKSFFKGDFVQYQSCGVTKETLIFKDS